MKNAPAIITFATLAVLFLLAVAASLIDSIPFAFVASYVVGFGCSAGFLSMFLADYGEASRRKVVLVPVESDVPASNEWGQGDRFPDPITVNFLPTGGFRKEPATLSLI